MGLVVLPNPLTDGTKAFGSEVKENDDAIVAQVNGQLDDANYKAASMTASAKLIDGTITTAKYADASITAVKAKDDGTPGEGMNLSELATNAGFNDTSGYPPNNINAGRKQHGGKTVWANFNLDDTNVYILDDSIDWRNRMIQVVAMGTSAGAALSRLPGGASDTNFRGHMQISGVATEAPNFSGNCNVCMFYSSGGSADGIAEPFGTFFIDVLLGGATPSTEIRISVNSANGNLRIKVQSFETATSDLDLALKIECSPQME